VLLWLHGGPGGAERPLSRYYNHELEEHFVVAYWDQRGAGRSFDADADPQDLTVACHLADKVWFENAAHNVPFEEPALFDEQVVKALRPVGITNGHQQRTSAGSGQVTEGVISDVTKQ
jgi:pimeloyl-ACP methyl ester carboxylesterase